MLKPILKVPSHLFSRRVLVVEDELLVAMDIESTLATAGLNVLGPVSSVSAGLALLSRERPDAAVLDLNLRGELVTPVAQRLRELDVPFVLSTAYNHLRTEEDDALRGIQNIGKPLPSQQLIRILGDMLQAGRGLDPEAA